MFYQPSGGESVWVVSADNDARLFEGDDLSLQIHLGQPILHLASASSSNPDNL
jgi:hypothetical protein